MSLFIKDMEMPESGYKTVYIHSNGYVYEPTNDNQIWNTIGKTTSIPTPHGKLKDADKLIKYIDDKYWDSPWIRSTALSIFEQEIKNAPTIIEAEKSKQ